MCQYIPQSLLFPRLLVLSNPPSQAGNGRHFLEEIGEWRGSPGAASGFLYGCAIKRLMLYSLKLQRNKPTKYLSMDSVNEKNWIKRLYFHRPVEMEQPYTTAAPFVCALSLGVISIFPQSLHLPRRLTDGEAVRKFVPACFWKALHSMWLFYLHSTLKIPPFYPVFRCGIHS